MNSEYQICSKCVMDTTDPDIVFDADGICNYCRIYEEASKVGLYKGEMGLHELKKIVEEIKIQGKDKEYDCIVGLSGGIDSTFAAYQAKKLGLRPLAVHLDNGWNSELAVRNIENTVVKMGMDLQTYVIDWEEFRDLQRSFFKASVVDIEMLTDHAITAVLHKIALEKELKHIISGNNIVTETIMPRKWKHRKSDLRNIKSIHKRFGTRKIETFPMGSTLMLEFYRRIKFIKTVTILNFLNYDKKEAMSILEKELGWKNYGGKHYESVFTRFYQAYILPEKFKVDKRKAHFSTLISSGQMTRDEALEELKKELYNSRMLDRDKKFVLKKLGFSNEEFDNFLKTPAKSHYDYPNDQKFVDLLETAKDVVRAVVRR